jgi:hypothetical protein
MNVTWERWWLAGTSTGRLYGGGGPLTGRPGNVKNSAWARFGGIILQRMVWGDGQKRFFRKCASVPCAGGCAEKILERSGVRTAVRRTQAPRADHQVSWARTRWVAFRGVDMVGLGGRDLGGIWFCVRFKYFFVTSLEQT